MGTYICFQIFVPIITLSHVKYRKKNRSNCVYILATITFLQYIFYNVDVSLCILQYNWKNHFLWGYRISFNHFKWKSLNQVMKSLELIWYNCINIFFFKVLCNSNFLFLFFSFFFWLLRVILGSPGVFLLPNVEEARCYPEIWIL